MKKNDLLFILVSSSILVAAWIIFSIYHAANLSTINETLAHEIEPINPNFNTEGINQLKNRQQISPAYDLQNTTQPSGAISITPTQQNVASPTATIGTQSGQRTQ